MWVFVFLFGLAALLGLFLTVFWGKVSKARHHELAAAGHHPWLDRYFLVATAVSALCAACAVTFGVRTMSSLFISPSSQILESTWGGAGVAVGLALFTLGLVLLVWLADLEREPPVWTWTRWCAVGTVAWGVVSALLSAYGLPLF